MPVTIEIPMLPDRALSPNARVHWREKAQAAAELRYAARMATLSDELVHGVEDVGGWRGAIMDAEIHWCCGRRTMDSDNAWASLKAARDGIADVLFGGEDRYITQGNLLQTRGSGIIIVTLREVDEV